MRRLAAVVMGLVCVVSAGGQGLVPVSYTTAAKQQAPPVPTLRATAN